MDKDKGYTQKPMYDDEMMYATDYEWPPKDMSETAHNHRRRVARNKRDENTR